ncbi:MAG: T9SS type A sorting domain-containing protein [Ignavibacteriaceae bacterium]|nr:T9SS type A sorting domain-containing protein [Ignavibacteriaceae bacterium]
MKKNLFTSFLLIISLMIGFIYFSNQPTRLPSGQVKQSEKEYPSDWFYMQRAFPIGEVSLKKYYDAIKQAKHLKELSSFTTANLWVLVGPTNIGGRISDIEMSRTNLDTIYAGIASGGVFKSVDQGLNWFPIFDETFTMSIGDLVVDPINPNIIYVGTGEVNGGGGSVTYGGNGVYKSTDAGATWNHLGLESTEYISRIIVDPVNPQNIYLGAMGKLFGKNSQRGLYKSTNGGTTWENKLFISDSTGCIDVAVNRDNPNIVYAAMWERIRRPDRRSYGGPTCGLYRSNDSGETWSELVNGLPNNSPTVGRIGISICESSPEIIYAIYADNIGYFAGVFKSTNSGDSWTRTNDGSLASLFSSFGWWFGNIRVDPTNPNNVYVLGLDIYKTTNAGSSWFYASGDIHVDQHGMYIHPLNPNFIVAGNDGGVYKTFNSGSSWTKISTMPITQFYTCEVDYQFPNRYYGGTQDNGTNRTLTGNQNDWHPIFGGDGFYVLVDPSNNNYVYAESQYGGFGRSIDGGNNFNYGLNGVSGSDRFNWSTPFIIDPTNPAKLYLGSNKVYKSINRAVSWLPISPDLTNGPPTGNQVYGTITTIASAASDTNVIYAGTDDANVWVTTNGGANWNNISTSLPTRWITRVAVDPNDASVAYVTLSGYRYDEYLPHVFRTTNAGISWIDISSNLPDAPVNDIIIDPTSTQKLYVATDVGVFVSDSLGNIWNYLGEGLPNSPVTDLVLHNPTRELIAATYGRSMYSISISTIPSITVVSPNGGEHWMMWDTVQVEWLATEVDSVKIELSLSEGIDWMTIAESIPNTGTFNWFVQAPFTSWYCLMKISDVSDSTIFDISDTTFTIDMFPAVEDSSYIFPAEFTLMQNYPNPFNPSTKIKFQIPSFTLRQAQSDIWVTLKVYDVLGNEVVTLVNEEKQPGTYEVEFNINSHSGKVRNLPADRQGLVSGIYFYQLKAGNYIETKKMVLIK